MDYSKLAKIADSVSKVADVADDNIPTVETEEDFKKVTKDINREGANDIFFKYKGNIIRFYSEVDEEGDENNYPVIYWAVDNGVQTMREGWDEVAYFCDFNDLDDIIA